MSAHNTRIWETSSNPISSPVNSLNHDTKPAQLPSIATLTHDLPSRNNQPTSPQYASNNRTSDPWGGSTTQSTRSSAYSSGFGYASSSISSPQRASNTSQFGTTSYPADFSSPTSAVAQASPGFASPPHDSRMSQLSQPEHLQHRSSHHSDSFPPQESRRSSLGSQVNTGFNSLQINGSTSPYQTHGNPSHSSIAGSLQRERGAPQSNGIRTSGMSAHQHAMSPLGAHSNDSKSAFQSRNAPSITHNPIREVYNADKPTAGQPYAFPDPDMGPEMGMPHEPNGRATLSRRNSDHGSLASSVITNDSKYPSGQIRLDEDPMPGTHHHSLQSKRISGTSADGDSPEGTSTPYSRTPALRASHKLAERKRRTEMKQLFDQLRGQIPAHHGAKSSKWEILSKASDYIKVLESEKYAAEQGQHSQMQQAMQEIEALRRENEMMKRDQHHYQPSQAPDFRDRPGTANTIQPQPSYASGPGAPPQPMQVDPARSLPPLANGIHASSSMQGVQYSEERR